LCLDLDIGLDDVALDVDLRLGARTTENRAAAWARCQLRTRHVKPALPLQQDLLVDDPLQWAQSCAAEEQQ
jgi:hypothetical protein